MAVVRPWPLVVGDVSRHRSVLRVVLRHWQYAIGALFVIYAWIIPDPHAFNNATVDRATWALGGLLMIWAGAHPERVPRMVAMLGAVGLCVVRITVLAAYPSDLTPGRVAAGAVVWAAMALLLVIATLASEMFDTPARLDPEH